MLFVKRGLELADVVYSLHKTSTRAFIIRKVSSLQLSPRDCKICGLGLHGCRLADAEGTGAQ